MKIELTPKGKSFLKYLENEINGVKQAPIEAYDKFVEDMNKLLNKKALIREQEYLKKHKKAKKFNIKIISCNKELSWYYDKIGSVFEVYNYNWKEYILTGENFGYLILKKDCILI